MTYKAIRQIIIYSEAHGVFSSLLHIQVNYINGTNEILVVDESEEPAVTELANRLDGTIRVNGGAIEFFSATFDTVSPDPWLVQWVSWAAEAHHRFGSDALEQFAAEYWKTPEGIQWAKDNLESGLPPNIRGHKE